MIENKYSNLVTQMPIAYAQHLMLYNNKGEAVDYRFLDVNAAFEDMTGLAANQVIGKTLLELLPKTESYWIQKYEECIRTGKNIYFENFSQSLNKYYQVIAYSPAPNQFVTMFLDVTERKNEFIKSENIASFYQSITENATDGVVILDETFKYSYVSPNAYKMFGYEQSEMRLLNPDELTHPDDLEFVLAEIQKTILSPNYKPTLEYRFRKKSGEWLWIESKVSNLFDNPNVNGLVINFKEITERKAFTENLLLSEERYRLTQAVGNIGSWEYDVNGRKFWSSPQLYHIFGIDENTADKNAEIESCVHNNDFIQQSLRQLIENNEPYDITYEITRKSDSKKRILKDVAMLYLDDAGKPELVRGILMDITEQKLDEIKLKKSEALLAATLKHSRFSIWSVDLNCCLLYANETFVTDFRAAFGLELVIGVNVIDLLPKPIMKVWLDRYQRAFANESFVEEDVIDLGDRKMYIEVSTTPILIDGVVMGASFYGEDITERKYSEEKLISNTQVLRKILKTADEFIKPKSSKADYDLITSMLLEISGAKFVILNKMHTEYTQTVSISGLSNATEIIQQYLNIDIFKHKWKRLESFESKWINNKTTVFPDFNSITSMDIQTATIRIVENAFNVGSVCVERIEGNNRVVGNLILVFEKGKELENSELIEMFTFQLGQYIERLNVEDALLQKMDEMERFHKLTVNRELNMIELKKEVNELLKKAGMAEKYRIVK